MPLAQKCMFRKVIFSENLLFLKKKKKNSLQWWESRRKTQLPDKIRMGNCLFLRLIYLFVQAINHRLKGRLKKNQTQKRRMQVKETQKSCLCHLNTFQLDQKGSNEMIQWVFASMGVIPVPRFHTHFIKVVFTSTWNMKRSNNIQPSNAVFSINTWSPTDRVLFEMSPSHPSSLFSPRLAH